MASSPAGTDIRLYIILKERIYRDSLLFDFAHHKDIELVGESSKGMEALNWLEASSPTTLLIEENLFDTDGLTVSELALLKCPTLNIVLLVDSVVSQKRLAIYLDSGIKSVISKAQPMQDLLDAVSYTRNGQIYISANNCRSESDPSDLSLAELGLLDQFYALSEREQEVASYIAKQWPLSKIADLLGVSHKTVHTYKERIFVKLGFQRLTELVVFVQRLNYYRMREKRS